MGFYRTAEEHGEAIRQRARSRVLNAVLDMYCLEALSRKLQQAREDAWYKKFQQAQKNRVKPD